MQQVNFDPGIFGFVKAHRHPSGCALVMSTWEEADRDWVAVFWVKRLIHNAFPISPNCFALRNERSIRAADRTYDIYLSLGPPQEAFADTQRLAVYDWEEDNIFPGHNTPMTWAGCRRFLNRVWQCVGTGKPLVLTDKYQIRKAIWTPGEIYLPPTDRDYWSRPVLLHEIAHELSPHAAHGPAFVSNYMDLVCRFLGHDRKILEESARRYMIDFET